MPQINQFFYFCTFFLILSFSASCGFAQSAPIDRATEQKEVNQTKAKASDPASDTCDFSDFNTLKEMPGSFISLPNPPHPKKAKRSSGDVQVRVLVNKEGQPEQACKVKGNDILAKSAINAALQIKISPEYAKKRLDSENKDFLEFVVTYKFKK